MGVDNKAGCPSVQHQTQALGEAALCMLQRHIATGLCASGAIEPMHAYLSRFTSAPCEEEHINQASNLQLLHNKLGGLVMFLQRCAT